jgi:dipeptidyl aminopeptidase/acylaminoacyl peptidase
MAGNTGFPGLSGRRRQESAGQLISQSLTGHCARISFSSVLILGHLMTLSRHIIDRGDGAAVELFLGRVSTANAGAMLFVHGNQGGLLLGGREAIDDGSLLLLSSKLNITVAAVSQPGFGSSDGPADFCGPATQRAIMAALDFLRTQPGVDPGRLVLYGNSRGAVASAMVAAQVPDLRAVILMAGVYDLKEVYQVSSWGLQRVIQREAGPSDAAFLDRSALYHAHRIKTDTLILHGKFDDRAPVDQAERFSAALSATGVPVALNIFECGHRIPREQRTPVFRSFLQKIFALPASYH